MKEKRLLMVVLSIFVAMFAAMAVGCGKKNPPSSTTEKESTIEFPYYGNYYFDGEDGENTLTIAHGLEFTLVLNGKTTNGEFVYVGGATANLSVNGKTATAAFTNDGVTLELDGVKYYFYNDVDYTVSFLTNGGNAVAALTVKNGKTVNKPANPTKEGYAFVGWYKNADFSGRKFAFNSEIVSGDITLYARWTKAAAVEYTVSFDLCYDGAQNPASMTTSGGKLYNVADPEREGYDFKGWWISAYNDADKLTSKYNDGETVFNKNTTLFALWEEKGADIFLVDVRENVIVYDGVKGVAKLSITGPDGSKLISDETLSSGSSGRKEFAFANKDAGEYKIEITCSSGTVTRYYVNKELAQVGGFKVEDGTLLFVGVENAAKYYITVDCGDESHNHTDVELDSTSYDFSACKMKVGGIVFTVKAEADGYITSVAKFVYERTLDNLDGLKYDESTGTISWNAVANATNYVLTINGERFNLGNVASFDVKGYTGDLKVTLVAEADGYNSSEVTEYNFTRNAVATPTGLKLQGKNLTWNSVDNATYTIAVTDEKGLSQRLTSDKTEYADFDKSLSFDFADGSRYTVTIMATVDGKDSLWSNPIEFTCLVLGDAPEYKDGYLTWGTVFGADGYEVCVNGNENEIISVKADTPEYKTAFDAAGTYSFKFRFVHNGKKSVWSDEITVKVYSIEFEENGGSEVLTMYVAENDAVKLPLSVKRGYDLAGWYDAPENGKQYTSAKFTESRNIKLYSNWKAREYQISLDYGEYGVGDSDTATVAYGSAYTLPVPSVSGESAMAFVGWYDTKTSGGLQYVNAKGESNSEWLYTGGVKLYARYVEAFEYTDNGNGGYIVKASNAFNSLVTELYIPATYKGVDVVEIDEYAFMNKRSIATVNIPDTIQSIASTAFSGCTGIEQFIVREAVEGSPVSNPIFTVGENGELLEHDYLRSQVELMFIPSTLTESAVEYIIPDTITRLGEYVFNKAKFNKVVIPASVTEVASFAFYSCSNLQSVEFLATKKAQSDEDEVKVKPLTIHGDSFSSTSKIKTLVLPERLQEVENFTTMLSGFKYLESIEVVGTCENQVYSSVDGMLCNITANGKADTVIFCPRSKVFETEKVTVKNEDGTTDLVEMFVWNVPEEITKINADAFHILANADSNYGYKLNKIVFHSGMLEVGDYAFYSMKALNAVLFDGDRVGKHSGLKIGAYAFSGCSNLAQLDFTDEGTVTGEGESYTFTASSVCGVTEIGEHAFYNVAIKNLVLPSTLTSIGIYAFGENKLLTTIDFSHAKTELSYGEYAFYKCDNLTTLDLTDNIYIEGFNVIFDMCSKLSEIVVKPTNPYYTTIDNVLYNKDVTTVIFFPDGYQGHYVLPKTVTKIAGGVFAGKTNLTQILITKNVTSIETSAFKNCYNITSLEFEDGGTEDLIIGDNAFELCYRLGTVILPDRTKKIGASAFAMNAAHRQYPISIRLNTGLEIIGSKAFQNAGIASITIPYTVTKIGSQAFNASPMLKTVIFEKTPSGTTPVSLAFETSKIIKNGDEVFVPNTDGTFASSGIVDIELPERLLYIPKYTFQNCLSLKRVTVPTTVSNATVFKSTGTAKEVVKGIGYGAFIGCINLSEIIFTSGGTEKLSFDTSAFAGCASLKELNLPSRIASFTNAATLDVFKRSSTSDWAFTSFGSYNVNGASYDAGITTINVDEGGSEYASYDGVLYTANLQSVVFCPYKRSGEVHIAYQATTFENCAFGGCSKITGIIFDETPEGIEPVDFELKDITYSTSSSTRQYFFYGCMNLKSIEFPSRLTKIGKYALSRVDGVSNGIANSSNAIEEITFAEGTKLKSIGDGAFKGLKIKSIVLPEIWEDGNQRGTVGKQLFSLCYNLESVTLPKNLTATEYVSIVDSMPTVKTLIFREGSKNFVEGEDGIVYGLENGVKTMLAYVPYVLQSETVTIPASVEVIAANAFNGRTGFKYLVFEEGGTTLRIGDNAFKASSVESVTLPASVVELGKSIFEACTNLSEVNFADDYDYAELSDSIFESSGLSGTVEIPSSVSKLNADVFRNTKVETVVFGRYVDGKASALTSVGNYMFYDCSELMSIKTLDYDASSAAENVYLDTSFPSSLASIGPNFAVNCVKLKKVALGDKITAIPNSAFLGCASLKEFVMPAKVKTIGSSAFKGCVSLKSVKLSEKTTLGTGAFQDSGIETIDGFEMITDIGSSAFMNSALKGEIKLDSSVKLTGSSNAFQGTKITKVELNCATIQSNIFKDCTELKEVVLGSSVTSIGMGAFYNCTKLEKVVNNSTKITTINGSTTEDKGAFANCINLEVFASPSQITKIEQGKATSGLYIEGSSFMKIGGYAFYNCQSLQTADLSNAKDKNLDIGQESFMNCTSLSEVKFPETIKTIAKEAFRNCTSLTELVVPKTSAVSISTAINMYAFADCTNLRKVIYNAAGLMYQGLFKGCTYLNSIDIIGDVTTIGTEAFAGCISLKSLTLPATVKEVNARAFENCTALDSLAFTSENMPKIDITSFNNSKISNIISNGGVFDNQALYIKNDDGSYTLFRYFGNATEFTVMNNTTAIGNNAFQNKTELTSVNLKTVKSVGDYAFAGCSSLATVTAAQLSTLGQYAFAECVSIESFNMSKISLIGQRAFKGCTSLKDIVLTGISRDNLGEAIFDQCIALKSVTLNAMNYISNYMFRNCTSLTEFSFDGITYVGSQAFAGCENLVTITDFEGVETLSYGAFSGCKSLVLKDADFSGAELSGVSVFENCESIISLTVGATNLAGSTFKNCKSLVTVKFANGLFDIGISSGSVFEGCESLDITTLDFSNVMKINSNAFTGCLKITELPDMPMVEEIASSAFKNCVNLKGEIDFTAYPNISWGSGVFEGTGITSAKVTADLIGSTDVLNGMGELTDLEVLGEITTISQYAFANCSKLSFDGIDFSKVTSIGYRAFENCLGLTEINLDSCVYAKSQSLGSGANIKYYSVFYGCTNLEKVSLPSIVINSLTTNCSMFANLPSLVEVNLPLMTIVPDMMFEGCEELEKVVAPEIRVIGKSAFKGCVSLKSLQSDKLDGAIGANAFDGCSSLESINITYAYELGAEAFKDCTKLNVTLSLYISRIGANVFFGWTSAQTIDISKALQKDKPSAWLSTMFDGCDAKVIWLEDKA